VTAMSAVHISSPVTYSPFGRMPYYAVTGGMAIIFLFPLAWTVFASIMPAAGTGQTEGIGFGNYLTLYNYGAGLPRFFLNSAIVSILTIAITLAVSTLGGYAFARFSFPGREFLFLLTLAILMIPYATLLIPLYVLLNKLGLQNSLAGVSLVMAMFQLPFATYMMRISFEAVPREIEESAQVDGCGTLTLLWRILIPAVRPGLITVGLFAFLAAWNDFFAPLILLTGTDKQTLPLAIATLRQQTMGIIDYGATQAGVVVMALPCLVLFIFLQRHFVRGFMSGALKG
jgi:multiple sugar transport system permease protein